MIINSDQVKKLDDLMVSPYKQRGEKVKKLLDLEEALTLSDFEKVARSFREAAFELHAQERLSRAL